jgi:hypothetical protein
MLPIRLQEAIIGGVLISISHITLLLHLHKVATMNMVSYDVKNVHISKNKSLDSHRGNFGPLYKYYWNSPTFAKREGTA